MFNTKPNKDMKKIIIAIVMLISLTTYSQKKELINIVSDFQGTVLIGVDTGTMYYQFKKIDSVDVAPLYTNYVAMIKSLSNLNISNFIIQYRKDQSPTDYPRIIVTDKQDKRYFISYNSLSNANKLIFDLFINKCKTKM